MRCMLCRTVRQGSRSQSIVMGHLASPAFGLYSFVVSMLNPENLRQLVRHRRRFVDLTLYQRRWVPSTGEVIPSRITRVSTWLKISYISS